MKLKFDLIHSRMNAQKGHIVLEGKHILDITKDISFNEPLHVSLLNIKTGKYILVDFHELKYWKQELKFFYGWNNEIETVRGLNSFEFNNVLYVGKYNEIKI